MKKYFVLILTCCLFFSHAKSSQAETITLSGKQTKQGQLAAAKLESAPVELTEGGTIVKARDARAGFWINKRETEGSSELIYQCRNPKEAIGKTLGKGIYQVFPNLPFEEQEMTVTLEIELGKVKAKPVKLSALEQHQYVVKEYYDKIATASGKGKKELCEKAIYGFQAVLDGFNDPRSVTTKKSASYYQAQCYRVLGDKENYIRSLKTSLTFLPGLDVKEESTISYMMSFHVLAKKELKQMGELDEDEKMS